MISTAVTLLPVALPVSLRLITLGSVASLARLLRLISGDTVSAVREVPSWRPFEVNVALARRLTF
jgi:hypothetical protein